MEIKPHKGGRTFRPSLRLTKTEWELIKQKAHALKMSVSDWMVFKAKNQRNKSEQDVSDTKTGKE